MTPVMGFMVKPDDGGDWPRFGASFPDRAWPGIAGPLKLRPTTRQASFPIVDLARFRAGLARRNGRGRRGNPRAAPPAVGFARASAGAGYRLPVRSASRPPSAPRRTARPIPRGARLFLAPTPRPEAPQRSANHGAPNYAAMDDLRRAFCALLSRPLSLRRKLLSPVIDTRSAAHRDFVQFRVVSCRRILQQRAGSHGLEILSPDEPRSRSRRGAHFLMQFCGHFGLKHAKRSVSETAFSEKRAEKHAASFRESGPFKSLRCHLLPAFRQNAGRWPQHGEKRPSGFHGGGVALGGFAHGGFRLNDDEIIIADRSENQKRMFAAKSACDSTAQALPLRIGPRPLRGREPPRRRRKAR